MKSPHFIVLVFCLLSFTGCAHRPQPTKAPNESIWLAIRVKQNQQYNDYRVQVSAAKLEALVAGKLKSEWIRLEPVYWVSGGNVLPQSEAAKSSGFSDTLITRVENIIQITPLTDAHIQQHLTR